MDFVIEQGRNTLAIEVKAAARWNERDIAGLEAFLAATPRCRVAVLAHGGRATTKLGDRLWAIPIRRLLA